VTPVQRMNETARQLGLADRMPENMPPERFMEMVSLILAELTKRGLRGDWSQSE
jgi:hypothetical protein